MGLGYTGDLIAHLPQPSPQTHSPDPTSINDRRRTKSRKTATFFMSKKVCARHGLQRLKESGYAQIARFEFHIMPLFSLHNHWCGVLNITWVNKIYSIMLYIAWKKQANANVRTLDVRYRPQAVTLPSDTCLEREG